MKRLPLTRQLKGADYRRKGGLSEAVVAVVQEVAEENPWSWMVQDRTDACPPA